MTSTKLVALSQFQKLFLSSPEGRKYAHENLALENEQDELDRKKADFWARAQQDMSLFIKNVSLDDVAVTGGAQ